MAAEGPFAVLLTKPERLNVMELAGVLAFIRKTPAQDQMITSRRAWGIVAENLSESDAQTLAAQLNPTHSSRVVPMSSIVVLPGATPLKSIEAGVTDGCVLVAAAAVTSTLTTTRLIKEGPSATQRVVSAGILLTTGLPIKIGPKKRTIEKKTESSDIFFYCDLIYNDPWRRRRIDAQKFDYSGLKERKVYNVLGNFKVMLSEFVRLSGAAENHGTRVLLTQQPVRTMDYASLSDLERECRWLLTLQAQPPSMSR